METTMENPASPTSGTLSEERERGLISENTTMTVSSSSVTQSPTMEKPTSPKSRPSSERRERPLISSHTATTASSSAIHPPLPPKPSFLKKLWTKIGITPFVIMIMVKPALAATISMAIYQKDTVAAQYLNFGYVIIIVSITTVPILPRGKFLMNLFVTLVMTCFAAGMVVLGQYCGIVARRHTTPAGASPAVANGYNSSASVINAIFLLLNIFLINALRAARPILAIPTIQYTIFVLVGFVYGPAETNVEGSHRFVKEVLYAFLTGQGIATGVALFIIPVSSRKVFFAETTGFLTSCREIMKKQVGFIEVLEHSKLNITKYDSDEPVTTDSDLYKSKRTDLKTATAALLVSGAKLREDVRFAKRETAYGHLNSKDIHELQGLMRGIMMPISGLSTIADLWAQEFHPTVSPLSPISARMGGSKEVRDGMSEEELDRERREWVELIHGAWESFENVTSLLDGAIVHILMTLKLIPASKSNKPKSTSETDKDLKDFANTLERKIEELREARSAELRLWAQKRNLESILQTATKNESSPPTHKLNGSKESLTSARLHIILYMEYLLYSTAKSIILAVRFADQKASDETLKKRRMIVPHVKTIVKWVKGLLNGSENPDDLTPSTETQTVLLGDGFQSPRDPEHLPPKNLGQKLGNGIRLIPKFFSSAPVAFGFRTAIAVFSIAIMAYLEPTHHFFIRQRVVWCLAITSIGMSPTAGAAIFNLAGNLSMTVVGMIGAYMNWYIPAQKTTGVIPLFFFFMCFYFYFAAKYPRFLKAIVAGALTHVLIIGYELQVRVIGIPTATATGQPYYPLYKLAPYRLLTVAAGVLVGYIFTIFPFPITEASTLRRDLGRSLFLLGNHPSPHLLPPMIEQRLISPPPTAKYLSCVTATLEESSKPILIGYGGGDHGRYLEKTRNEILGQLVGVIYGLRENLMFVSFEVGVGGRFPGGVYEGVVDDVQSITYYLAIIAYACSSLKDREREDEGEGNEIWVLTHRRISRRLVGVLAILSSGVRNSQALPPYLCGFDHGSCSGDGDMSGLVLGGDGDGAVVVVDVAMKAVGCAVERIVGLVRELVGEVDFGYMLVDGEGVGGDDRV